MRDGRRRTGRTRSCSLCYRGDDNVGIHLLGPLAKKVVRVAPPLVITDAEAQHAMDLMNRLLAAMV